eukprot:TRINITY_DN460_c0_g1_i2.p2 TRINITY_DN460_c0_g1~~TRINITY_DN460_c0_g1_i2.p2  ORF type:complete len:100 (+),score=29.68 TRINITY_DN460_c0_g1_i2:425-724(+)
MSIKEKKQLYRASFCQTLAELEAPDPEWKESIGISLLFASLAAWIYIAAIIFCYDDIPETLTDEAFMKAQIERMIANRVNPVTGFTSDYDYEKNEWKKH